VSDVYLDACCIIYLIEGPDIAVDVIAP